MKGKSAIVTGSTSGVGLGIGHASAARGPNNIMLNSFGDTAESAQVRKTVASPVQPFT